MKINEQQMASVMALTGAKRYQYFIKRVVDWEEVWGLYQDGWALASTGEGEKVLPFWPAKEYAMLCATQEWLGYSPKVCSLADFMGELLPQLQEDGVLPGIFYTQIDTGVTPTVKQLLADLEAELDQY